MGDHLVDSSKLRKLTKWSPVVHIRKGIFKVFNEDIPGGTS